MGLAAAVRLCSVEPVCAEPGAWLLIDCSAGSSVCIIFTAELKSAVKSSFGGGVFFNRAH